MEKKRDDSRRHSTAASDDIDKPNQPDDLPFDADFLLWTVAAVPDAAASVGGGLMGFFALFPSFDGTLSPLRLIVYGNSSELVNAIPNKWWLLNKCTQLAIHRNNHSYQTQTKATTN